ncbi:MAG: MerR family transcriptional regulator [Clostridiaceae bacterium]
MGKKNLTIGEISEILNITPSTLRFWEKENLFHVSKKSNHYRTYTNTDLKSSMADIICIRSCLELPV